MNRSLFSIVFSLCLYATQCRKPEAVVQYIPPPAPVDNSSNAKNFLALGDSYTIGQSVDSSERFPSQTVALLRNMGILINSPKYIARTGWTTDDLSAAIISDNPSNNYDVVTLLIGVNDQYQRHDTTGYRMKFLDLLNDAITHARGTPEHVVVVSIPDYSVTPFAAFYDTAFIRRQIDQFNEINRQVTSEKHSLYLDITPSTREALNDRTLIASDGLHPSGKEYQKWAQRLSVLIQSFLR